MLHIIHGAYFIMSLSMVAVAEWHRKPAFIKNSESVLSLPLCYLTHAAAVLMSSFCTELKDSENVYIHTTELLTY